MFFFVVANIIIVVFVQLVMHVVITVIRKDISGTMNTKISGYCEIYLKLNGRDYKNVRISLLTYLCSDVILGHDFQKQHLHLKFNLGRGVKPGLVVPFPSDRTCTVSTASTCRPIATKSQHFSVNDKQ